MNNFNAAIVLLLCVSSSCMISTDVTYTELEELDATCHYLDTCTVRRSLDTLDKYTCHCDAICSKLRTCCIDSPYRDIKMPGRRPSCKYVQDEHAHPYFMVDKCSLTNDDDMEKLCKETTNDQENLTPLIPVTSLATNVTYKNYYCFKCNEATENFLYWNLKINSNFSAEGVNTDDTKLTYDADSNTWMASFGEQSDKIPVTLFVKVPSEIQTLPKTCMPNAISTCSGNWKDQDVRRKCLKYTSYVYIVKEDGDVRYRNPHCALCNFENLERMGCGHSISKKAGSRPPFSLAVVLDFNESDGNRVGKIQLCDNNSTWDPHFKKCKKYTCFRKNYVVKDGKCVPP